MKTLITGKNGQLGQELQNKAPEGSQLIALDRTQLDISNAEAVMDTIGRYQPDLIINAAAYTAVDKAEEETEQAYATNATGPENLAIACKEHDARLIHISTDFVFDGEHSSPYEVTDSLRPLGAYGESKAAGEAAVQAVLPEAVILRTAWVYASHGKNFVNTMLRLMAERDHLDVVADQIGTPTWTGTLADAIYALAHNSESKGIYHHTDAGVASWYDFAVAIFEEGKAAGLLPQEKQVEINPITTADFPTPARRPAYSVLDKSSLTKELDFKPTHWRQSLRQALTPKS